MGLQQVAKAAETLIAQGVKKAHYITPTCRVGTAEELGIKLEQLAGDTVQIHKSPLGEFMSYVKGFATQGKEYKHVVENPNSPFAKYLEFLQSNKLKKNYGRKEVLFKPLGQDAEHDYYALNNYKMFLFNNAEKLPITKEEYFQIIDKFAKICAEKTKLENPHINSALIDNAEKIYKWQEIFQLQNRFKIDNIHTHKFHDEKIFNKAVEEFRAFYEAQTGKKVLIGCPSRMEYSISTLEILNDPKVYKDVDCIILGHGKGSSLITDISNSNTWRFSDNDISIYEFIEQNAKGKKVLVTSCETDGLKLAGLTETPMDNNGVKMYGIGQHVMAGFPENQPLKYVQSGTRHITGHAYTVNSNDLFGNMMFSDGDSLTIGTSFKIVPYSLDYSKITIAGLKVENRYLLHQLQSTIGLKLMKGGSCYD